VVIALKQTPPLVHNLRAEYDALTGCLTVDRETLASLERITRTAVRDDASLLSPVESLGERARAEYERGYQAGLERHKTQGRSSTRKLEKSAAWIRLRQQPIYARPKIAGRREEHRRRRERGW
jgi:hypothetical protein